ncbi:MAG: radical SAM protein [Candidatus Diapherotrites archaeon]|nr:radical SAM protein [Candidatus Diapherotrites archaeon]
MKRIQNLIGSAIIKSALFDLSKPIGVLKKSRAELILDRLFEEKKEIDWDIKCRIYFFLLNQIMAKMIKENKITMQTAKKFFQDYPIFRRILNKTLKLFLQSITEYGITMPQKLSAPLLVEFELTNKCNLACKHCYANSGSKFAKELDLREVKEILNQINQAGVPLVCFTGGEPLLRPDFFDILSHAKRIGLVTIVTTNGTLITKEKARKFKELGTDYIRISLDGASIKTHDWLRGIPGAYKRTVQGIRNSIEAGNKTGIGTVLIQENVHELENLIDLAAQLGCTDINAIPLIESGRAKSTLNKEIHEMSNEQKKKNEELIVAKAKEYEGKMLLNFLDLDHIRRVKGSSKHFVGWAQGGCAAGRTVCVINPNGEIRPCITLRLNVGSLQKQKFVKIWKNSKIMEELKNRSLVKGSCGKCESKYTCGGCRAAAYDKFGDYLESDPGCYVRYF